MFRPMRRKNQALSNEQCLNVLESTLHGVLSLIGDDGYPYGVMLSHFYSREDGCIYFHGATEGHKIDAVKSCEKACYTVLSKPAREEGDWAEHFQSVVCFGKMSFISDPVECEELVRKIAHQFTQDEDYIADDVFRNISSGKMKVLCLKLTPEHITGKNIREA